MKYTFSIGVGEYPLTILERRFIEELKKKLRAAGISTGRCNVDGNIVEAFWQFEGVLDDPDYAASRLELMLLLTGGNPLTIKRFAIETSDTDLGGENTALHYYDAICGKTVYLMPRKHYVIMFLHEPRIDKIQELEKATRGFQRMCEWFTILTSVHKAMGQGHTALTTHHRYADAAGKFEEGQRLVVQALRFPPETF